MSVGELPKHKHDANSSVIAATGSFGCGGYKSPYYGAYHTATGVFALRGSAQGSISATDSSGGGGQYVDMLISRIPTITVAETGNNTAHNNMQPFFAVFLWKRTI